MSKMIVLTHNGKDYTLGFTRETVRLAERRGLEMDLLNKQPMIQIPLLVQSAFIANHKFVSADQIDSIYADITVKDEFLTKLTEMYYEPIKELMGASQDEDGEPKKANWEASF